MADTNAREKQDDLVKTISPSEVTVEANEEEQKGSALFRKKSEGETKGQQDDGNKNEEPKHSTETEGSKQRGDLMQNIPVCEIIIVKTNEEKMGSGVITVPVKDNEEETSVHPAAMVEPNQPNDGQGKTHHKENDDEDGEKEEEGRTKEEIIGHPEEKEGKHEEGKHEENKDA